LWNSIDPLSQQVMIPEPSTSDPPIEMTGHLLFLKRYPGSKSERFFPRLIGVEGQGVWLKHKEDDSFNHATLREWHCRYVRVRAVNQADGLMLVDQVVADVDPFLKRE
jgi:hypothetical protein